MSLLPSLASVQIAHLLLREMEAERRTHHPSETGGVLLGRRSSRRVCVEWLVGPGPKARHESRNFEPDTEWQRERIADAFGMSGGSLDYLGDWHSHTSASARASIQDWRTAMLIARYPQARCPQPIILIVAAGHDRPRRAAYCLSHRLLVPVSVDVV